MSEQAFLKIFPRSCMYNHFVKGTLTLKKMSARNAMPEIIIVSFVMPLPGVSTIQATTKPVIMARYAFRFRLRQTPVMEITR